MIVMHDKQEDLLACQKQCDQELRPIYTHAVANTPKLCIKLHFYRYTTLWTINRMFTSE